MPLSVIAFISILPLSGAGRRDRRPICHQLVTSILVVALVAVVAIGFAGVAGAVVHELVEFRLVLRLAQALQEGFEVFLLFLEAAKCVSFVAVKRRVA